MEDSIFADWPKELHQEYDRLSLPTLYDLILSQEKISAEVRKQNIEVRQLKDSIISRMREDKETKESLLEEQERVRHQQFLMQGFDAIVQLELQIDKSMQEITSAVAHKRGLKKKQTHTTYFEAILRSIAGGVFLVKEKLTSLLSDLELEPFFCKNGDLFSPLHHRAVLQQNGGEKGIIFRMVRPGYRYKSTTLRCADVIVYQGKKHG